ncbi:unnamed protein product [Echinostoma caproni]|uniref:Uncharacterized protein n=1 Tax=Echinostoma caproni TaxID=27848 RepID=A0A183BAG0_9TREM|nr:unnamed protein product [Echinostoma caproni]
MCAISKKLAFKTSSTIRLTSKANPSAKFQLRLSGDPETAASSLDDAEVALSEKVEAALLVWIPVERSLFLALITLIEESCAVMVVLALGLR